MGDRVYRRDMDIELVWTEPEGGGEILDAAWVYDRSQRVRTLGDAAACAESLSECETPLSDPDEIDDALAMLALPMHDGGIEVRTRNTLGGALRDAGIACTAEQLADLWRRLGGEHG